MGDQSIEDGALDAEIDGDNAEGRVAAALQTLIEANTAGLIPLVGLTGCDAVRQVQPLHRRGLLQELKQLRRGLAVTADHAIHGPHLTQVTHQGTGVQTADAHQLVGLHPALKGLFTAPVAGNWGQLAGNHATGMGAISFLIVSIHPGVTEFGIGEAHQLPGIGGVGQHLLVTGHAGVEHHLTDGGAAMAEADTGENRAIGKDEISLV
jgi:hypothetical protein